ALRCELDLPSALDAATQDLIVVPASCLPVSERIGERRAVGLWAHVYSLRSRASWGVGDLGDLHRVVGWAASLGLDFVGINPLHPTSDSAREVSPYHPLSRLYRSPVYLDVGRAFARVGGAEGDAGAGAPPAELAGAHRVDYARAFAAKRGAFERVHESFLFRHRDGDGALARAYAAYCRREGQELRDWAIFCALREELVAQDPRHADWRRWPEAYRDPRSPAVAAFAAARSRQVDLHAYLQFELEEQLGSCQEAARGAGMADGLYGDLALG